jgi:alkaline phosphatase
MIRKNILISFVLLALISACSTTQPLQEEKKAKNVIFLIGDGMGLSQISTTFYYNPEKVPSFTRFKKIGLINTSSGREKVTDSASSATAYSTGVRTYNGAIGVDLDTLPIQNVVEFLSPQGYSTGLVSTSSIVHATPASFFAHIDSRSKYESIAAQLVHSDIDFFAGGGNEFFSKRSDGLNYLDSLGAYGFNVDTASLDAFRRLEAGQKYGYLLADDGMPEMTKGRGDFLLEATEKAIDYLKQDEDGFFLMSEGSQIDWAGHSNNLSYLIREMIDFDMVIDAVLDFAEKDGNTLVVVTADHETGGFSLSAADIRRQANYSIIQPGFNTPNHSATLVPVFAYGPGAELFQGVYNNNEVFNKILEAMGKKLKR